MLATFEDWFGFCTILDTSRRNSTNSLVKLRVNSSIVTFRFWKLTSWFSDEPRILSENWRHSDSNAVIFASKDGLVSIESSKIELTMARWQFKTSFTLVTLAKVVINVCHAGSMTWYNTIIITFSTGYIHSL